MFDSLAHKKKNRSPMDLEHDAIDKQIDYDHQNNQMNIHIDG